MNENNKINQKGHKIGSFNVIRGVTTPEKHCLIENQ